MSSRVSFGPAFGPLGGKDGSTTDFVNRTDKQGRLDEKGGLRAAAGFVLEIRSPASRKVLWTSRPLAGSTSELDLGEIVLDGLDDA